MDVAGTVRSDGLAPPHPPPAACDADVVARLRAARAMIVAKTNLEALRFGATTQNRYRGACRNPWDPGRSSGGSAVAVAAGFVDAALETDTGSSLRNLAAFCGISALRQTLGSASSGGVTPLSPSMDVVGPIARRGSDLRRLFAVLADPAPGGRDGSETRLSSLRVGIPSGHFLRRSRAGGRERDRRTSQPPHRAQRSSRATGAAPRRDRGGGERDLPEHRGRAHQPALLERRAPQSGYP